MHSQLYYPMLWLLVAALALALFATSRSIAAYRRRIAEDADLYQQCRDQIAFLMDGRRVLWMSAAILVLGGTTAWCLDEVHQKQAIAATRARLMPVFDKNKVWEAPDPYLAESADNARLIAYGRDLIAHTQDYYGPKGSVRPGTINGLNCQNCHLEAGTKPFGNNYFAVESTYPQMRARSGTLETIPKRVNDCFQRSLNGQAIDTTSREMLAIMAYMQWLGTGVPKSEKPKGTGLPDLPFLDRAADPELGRAVYDAKCSSCHGTDGQGLPMPDGSRNYPALWGARSYNEAAGLYRLSRFASYVKANMPFGANYLNPQLSDEEAWDVAAFINSQPRPEHPFLATDWPKIEKKPFDHPFGPFADTFPVLQHKYGPFGAIAEHNKSLSKKN